MADLQQAFPTSTPMTMPEKKAYELAYDEWQVILKMRKLGPFANFRIEKRPTKDTPDGRLVTITSELKENLFNLTPREFRES